jgi:hypothetical protein
LIRRRALLLVAVALVAGGVVGGTALAAGSGAKRASSPARQHRVAGVTTPGFVAPTTLLPGQSKTIASVGSLALNIVCQANGEGRYDLRTTMAHTEIDMGPQDDDFGPGTDTVWGPKFGYEGNTDGNAIAPDGSAIFTTSIIYAGTSNSAIPGKCIFGGEITTTGSKLTTP